MKNFSVRLVLPLCASLSLFQVSCDAAPARLALDSTEKLPLQSQKITLGRDLPYKWQTVQMGAGGYITGFAAVAGQKPALYMRADVSGVFKRDFAGKKWIPLSDGFTQSAPYYVEALAVDPRSSDTVYFAAGNRWSGHGDVFKSSDGGKTWRATGLKQFAGDKLRMDGNADFRAPGERLAVDPQNSSVVYYGSRDLGLFASSDGAATWKRIESFPAKGAAWKGIPWVVLDPTGARVGGRTSVIYAGVAGDDKTPSGIFVSRDGGATWNASQGAPTMVPTRGEVARDGALYVTGSQGVWKQHNGAWRDISPTKGSFRGLGLSPHDAARVVVFGEKTVFFSADGGAGWKAFNEQAKNMRTLVKKPAFQPWKENKGFGSDTADLAFDPIEPNRVWLGAWGGQYSTPDITADVTQWALEYEGSEEWTIAGVVSPPQGAPLLSLINDLDGTRHESLTQSPQSTLSAGSKIEGWEDTTSLDFCETQPQMMARVGGWKWKVWQPGHGDPGEGGFSIDGGKTWANFATKPQGAMFGHIAVAANDPRNLVWISKGAGMPPYFTRDGGKTWQAGQGGPDANVWKGFWESYASPIASDRVKANTFYSYDHNNGGFFRSDDGGATWRHTATLPAQGGQHYDKNVLAAVPGIAGEVWAALDDKGLFRSRDGGQSWTKLQGIERASALSFGKPANGFTTPTTFLFGQITGASERARLFRSDDGGATWHRINDDAHGMGLTSHLAGDRQKAGRIYVGTNGRGVFWGEAS